MMNHLHFIYKKKGWELPDNPESKIAVLQEILVIIILISSLAKCSACQPRGCGFDLAFPQY